MRAACWLSAWVLIAAGCGFNSAEMLWEANHLRSDGLLHGAADRYQQILWRGATSERDIRREAARGLVAARRELAQGDLRLCAPGPLHDGVSLLGSPSRPLSMGGCWLGLLNAIDYHHALEESEDVADELGLEAAKILMNHGHFEEGVARAMSLTEGAFEVEARTLVVQGLWLIGDRARLVAQLERWYERGVFDDEGFAATAARRVVTLCGAFELRGRWGDAADCFERLPAFLVDAGVRIDAAQRAEKIRALQAHRRSGQARRIDGFTRESLDPAHQWRLCRGAQDAEDSARAEVCWSRFIQRYKNREDGEVPVLVLEARLERVRLNLEDGETSTARALQQQLAREMRADGDEASRWWLAVERSGDEVRVAVAFARAHIIEAALLLDDVKEQRREVGVIQGSGGLKQHIERLLSPLTSALERYHSIARDHRDSAVGFEALWRAGLTLHEVSLWLTPKAANKASGGVAQERLTEALFDAAMTLEGRAFEWYRAAIGQVLLGRGDDAMWLIVRRLSHELSPSWWPALMPEAVLWRWPAPNWSVAASEAVGSPRRHREGFIVTPRPLGTSKPASMRQLAVAHHLFGVISLKQTPEQAQWSFEKAITIDPGHTEARLDLARLLLENDHHRLALYHLDQALQRSSSRVTRARAHLLLGMARAHLARRELQKLPALWRQPSMLTRSFPVLASYLMNEPFLPPGYPVLVARRSDDHVVEPDPLLQEELRGALDEALEHFYLSSAVFPAQAGAQIALIQRDLGFAALAEQTCEEVLAEQHSSPPEALHSCALVALANGHASSALSRLREAVERAPDAASPRLDLGWLLLQLDPRQAHAMFLSPALIGHEEARLGLLESVWRAGRLQEAQALLAQLPASPERDFQEVLMLIAQERFGEAHAAATRYLEEALRRGEVPSKVAHVRTLIELMPLH